MSESERDIDRIADPRIGRPRALNPDAGIDDIEHHAEGSLARRTVALVGVARIDEQAGGVGIAILFEDEMRLEPLDGHMADVSPREEKRGDPMRGLDALDHHRLAGAIGGDDHDILEDDRTEPGERRLRHLHPTVEVGDKARHPPCHP